MPTADLEFRIGAELTEIKGALASLKRDFATVGQAANQAGGRNAFANQEKGAGSMVRSLAGVVAGFVSDAAAIKLIGAADALKPLSARLRAATFSTEMLHTQHSQHAETGANGSRIILLQRFPA